VADSQSFAPQRLGGRKGMAESMEAWCLIAALRSQDLCGATFEIARLESSFLSCERYDAWH
jgi:hypothetical protein